MSVTVIDCARRSHIARCEGGDRPSRRSPAASQTDDTARAARPHPASEPEDVRSYLDRAPQFLMARQIGWVGRRARPARADPKSA